MADLQRLAEVRSEVHDAKILAARALIRQFDTNRVLTNLGDTEFKVFSQFGDDGIIQYLVRALDIQPHSFVEFGVENYREANIRFLLVNNNWQGLVLDASSAHIRSIQNDDLYGRYDLTALSAFIDCDNINELLTAADFSGELGILSIDIDENDYWVWERLEVVDPTVVIVEYNSLFGAKHPVFIPYDPSFCRTNSHYSNLYWGCSIQALCSLAERKGYAFVGCNSNGNNAYFVRRDCLGTLKPLAAEVGYVEARFRESRDRKGKLTYLSGEQRRQMIGDLPVVDVETGRTHNLSDLE